MCSRGAVATHTCIPSAAVMQSRAGFASRFSALNARHLHPSLHPLPLLGSRTEYGVEAAEHGIEAKEDRSKDRSLVKNRDRRE